MADDVVAAPRGATVYGRIANAQSAGRMAGGAELTLELTDITINGTAYPLLTSTYGAVAGPAVEDSAEDRWRHRPGGAR